MFSIRKCNIQLKLAVANSAKYSKAINSNLKFLLETMPKVPKHIPDAQRQRKLIKEKFSKYVPGRITLQVLGSGAVGAPRSLYVFSDQSRYLFNCGEGTQRLAHEHKMKLAKLEHVFVTQSSWNNIGGLPGIALTIQDVGVPQITLHGPKGLDEVFAATRRFVIIRDLHIEVADCESDNVFEDNVMKVKYVPIKKTRIVHETIAKNETVQKSKQNYDEIMDDKSQDLIDNAASHNSRNRSKSCSPNRFKDSVLDCIDYYAHERKTCFFLTKTKCRSRSESRRTFDDVDKHLSRLSHLKDTKEDGNVMCYVCKLQPRPGALSLDKCVRYGVPSGPLLGKLKNGEDVKLPSGTIVRSTDVCEPNDPGPVFLVVDCPSEDYLDSFIAQTEFEKYQESATDDELLACLVVHFTPSNIIDNPKYCKWIDKFSPSTQHILLNDSNTCMGSESVHRIQYKMNLLHNGIFPLLGDQGSKYDVNKYQTEINKRLKIDAEATPDANCSKMESENVDVLPSFCDRLIRVNTFCNFHLRPKKGLDRSNELLLKPSDYIEETMLEKNFSTTLCTLRDVIKEKTNHMQIRQFPRFLFLGTGSCIPNKTRNTSGILFEASNVTNILLDCGEGTYGQLVRFYGASKTDQILLNLKAIFVSHLHADHHIGLIGILQGRRRALNKLNKTNALPLFLLAPKQIMTWLNFYDQYFENISQEFELIPNDGMRQDEYTLFEGTRVRLNLALGMTEINTTYVRHCPNAFGVAFTAKNGYKICYSGDTMPSENLINLGMRCDLLIHEATMEDELEKEAVVKMHSTTSQAIEVGRNMNAKHILLTHFSQRYAKLPKFNDNFTENIGIAFDNMQICLDELPLLPLFYPALRIMFAEHYEELETKSMKRQLRLEREESSEDTSSKQNSSFDELQDKIKLAQEAMLAKVKIAETKMLTEDIDPSEILSTTKFKLSSTASELNATKLSSIIGQQAKGVTKK